MEGLLEINAFAVLVKGTVITGSSSVLLVLTLSTDTMSKLWNEVQGRGQNAHVEGGWVARAHSGEHAGTMVGGLGVDLLTRGYV